LRGIAFAFFGLIALPLGFLFACSSSSSGSSLTCGQGTVERGHECIAGEADASDASSSSTDEASDAAIFIEGGDGQTSKAPQFAGVQAVGPASSTALLAAWKAGTDPSSPVSPLRYRVYVAPAGHPIDYTMPATLTAPGALSAVIGGLQTNGKYTVGVRAVNASGLADSNLVTLPGTTANDTTARTFSGAQMASPVGGGQIKLSWTAATDDFTPAGAMTYVVYESDTSTDEDFTSPLLVSDPGATSVIVDRLPNAMQRRYFVVRARDAAGNLDTNTTEVSSTPGPDVLPPVFGGCLAATKLTAVTVNVAWAAASDDVSAPQNISYDVFLSTMSGAFDFTRPFATVKGIASTVLNMGLMPATTYAIVCRAKDEAGNEDSNTVEVNVTTGTNPVPPTFAGINLAGFMGDPVARTATIPWLAAMDVSTTPDKMFYDVYVSETMGGEDFAKPPYATSAMGATSITLINLPPNATLYFVVRARDEDGNRDSNTVEASFTTNVSFSLNVQPIFAVNCGVVGCHVPGQPTGGLILAQGFTYSQIVGVTAPEVPTLQYVAPGDALDSYVAVKINYMGLFAMKGKGTQMPAPSTGSTLSPAEINTIANWIIQGAANN
jgi:hypothetical protein